MGPWSLAWLVGDPPFGLNMVKQIKEQVDILSCHIDRGEIDTDFVSLHAAHLSQLANGLSLDRESEISKRQKEFLRLLGR